MTQGTASYYHKSSFRSGWPPVFNSLLSLILPFFQEAPSLIFSITSNSWPLAAQVVHSCLLSKEQWMFREIFLFPSRLPVTGRHQGDPAFPNIRGGNRCSHRVVTWDPILTNLKHGVLEKSSPFPCKPWSNDHLYWHPRWVFHEPNPWAVDHSPS